jgi:hypothetical protein
MTISINVQRIISAKRSPVIGELDVFDVVYIEAKNSGTVALHLPHGTGQAVADAINAAVKS